MDERKGLTITFFFLNYFNFIRTKYSYCLFKIAIFKKELEELKEEHAELEKENITLMGYLFECSTDELKNLK